MTICVYILHVTWAVNIIHGFERVGGILRVATCVHISMLILQMSNTTVPKHLHNGDSVEVKIIP